MKTQRRILLVVGVLVLACAGLMVLAEFLLGAMLGSVVVLGAVVIMTAAYFGLVRPWLLCWGATAGEVARPMPGDGILRGCPFCHPRHHHRHARSPRVAVACPARLRTGGLVQL